MIGTPLGMMLMMNSSNTARVRETAQKLESEHRLVLVGTAHVPEGVILTPEEILLQWRVPASELLVEVGTVPLAVMQEITREPDLLRRLDPRQFEATVAEILNSHGFKDVKLTPRSGDGGKDITACQMVMNIPVVFYFECKRYREDRPVELSDLRALLGTVSHDKINKGVLVTTSRFTQGGKDFIAQNAMLQGSDYDDLVGWVEKLKK